MMLSNLPNATNAFYFSKTSWRKGWIPWNLLLRNTHYIVSALHADKDISRVWASSSSSTAATWTECVLTTKDV